MTADESTKMGKKQARKLRDVDHGISVALCRRVAPPPYMARLSGRQDGWCRLQSFRQTALQHRCKQ